MSTQIDKTESLRHQLTARINTSPDEREALEARHGKVWETSELTKDFEVIGFAAPLVVVKRKADGQVGSLFFQQNPRLYFGYQPD